MIIRFFGYALFLIGLSSCSDVPKPLPILGQIDVVNGDTIRHEIPEFRFINQDSVWITNETFSDKIYVSDFFFTSCPSICPKVKKQMLRMYEIYKDDGRIVFISHSIDTKRDSVPRLKLYANNLGVQSKMWHFVTGDKEEIFNIADDYFVAAMEDSGAPGGFDHSGRLILVDKNRHIRAFCEGTKEDEVTRFMKDINQLLDTY